MGVCVSSGVIVTSEMPLFRRKDTIDYKSRLERKLCIARDNPEPVFDLSQCKLKTVPKGIFSLCKVFQKEALLLQDNNLNQLTEGGVLSDLSLIQVLNLESNNFTKLPSDIGKLTNLSILNVSHNLLQTLPETIDELRNLVTLDVSNNKLQELPKSLGYCTNLRYLYLQCNPKLKSLPVTIGHLHLLQELTLDSSLQYPPTDVCQGGVASIVQFLKQECGDDVLPQVPQQLESKHISFMKLAELNNIQEKLKQLEYSKLEKQREMIDLELSLAEEHQKELEVQEAVKKNKNKLVENLKTQQKLLDEEIFKLQERKEEERIELVKQLNFAEEKANNTVEHLLACSRKLRENAVLNYENDLKREEELLLNMKVTVEETKVLDAMNALMEDELHKIEQFRQYEKFKEKTTHDFVINESYLSLELMDKLNNIRKDKTDLTEQLQRDEELQKAAVATLMERGDTRSWELTQQVALVEAKLAEITQLELAKKRAEVSDTINDISSSRLALTTLLLDLFEQQNERRKQLMASLQRIEGSRGDDDNFWLEQYQRLLNSKFALLEEKKIDRLLANCLVLYNVFHYLPQLSEWVHSMEELEKLREKDLVQVGITDEEDQACILKAIREYLTEKAKTAPSAPSPESCELASAPILPEAMDIAKHVSEDCVICLDEQCCVIFLPCGHMCCCVQCCINITLCPLCRTDIREKIQALHSHL